MKSIVVGVLLVCMVLLLLRKALETARHPLLALAIRRRLERLRSAPPLRELSSAEMSVLHIFLDSQGSRLVDTQVRSLTGAHDTLFHPFGGGVLRRELIDGVEVRLPQDGSRHLVVGNNAAEVVLTPQYAIALKLNGFDLLATLEEAPCCSPQDGDLAQSEAPPALSDCSAENQLRYQRGEVDLLGERLESPAEVAARLPQRFGTLDRIILTSGMFCLLFISSTTFDGRWFAVVFVATALLAWLAVRGLLRRELNEPGKVLRYRGRWNEVALGNDELAERHHYLGHSIRLKVPSSWLPAAALLPVGQVLDVDVRDSDNLMLRMGHRWSQDEQWQRIPSAYAARSLFLLVVALLALAGANRQMDDLAGTLAMAKSWLTPSEVSVESPDALVKIPPAFGQPLRLQGRARCELVAGERAPGSLALPTVDCRRLRWGGSLAIPPLQLSPTVLRLFHGDFIRAKKNPWLNTGLRIQANLDASYPEGRFPLVIQNLPEALRVLDEVCQPTSAPCEDLRQQLATDVVGLKEGPAGSWQALQARVQTADQVFVIRPWHLEQIRRSARDLVAQQVETEVAGLVDQLLSSQQAGVLLVSDAPLQLPSAHVLSPPENSRRAVSLTEYWSFLEVYASPESLVEFDVSRSVVAVEQSQQGLVIRISPPFSAAAGRDAFVLILWLSLASLLAIVSGIQFAVRLPLALRRHAQRIDYQRQVAGQPDSALPADELPSGTAR